MSNGSQDIGALNAGLDLDAEAGIQEAAGIELTEAGVVNDLTPQQLAYMVHKSRLYHLKNEMDSQAANLKEGQKKVETLHEIMQEINNAIALDKDGKLDISKNKELQQKLKTAAQMGVKIPEGKTKFTATEATRLLDNFHFTVSDMDLQNNLLIKKVNNLYTESQQSILFVKDTHSSIYKAILAIIQNIK